MIARARPVPRPRRACSSASSASTLSQLRSGHGKIADPFDVTAHLAIRGKGTGEKVEERMVRFRTLGCYPLTGAIPSNATTLEEIVGEMLTARTSERQGRLIDRDECFAVEVPATLGEDLVFEVELLGLSRD